MKEKGDLEPEAGALNWCRGSLQPGCKGCTRNRPWKGRQGTTFAEYPLQAGLSSALHVHCLQHLQPLTSIQTRWLSAPQSSLRRIQFTMSQLPELREH